MPVISQFYGIIITMFTADHNPPHFHAKYQSYRISININDGSVVGFFPEKKLKLVLKWYNLHKDELLICWQLLQSKKKNIDIDPL